MRLAQEMDEDSDLRAVDRLPPLHFAAMML